ncbi:MAG: hypothetical protein WD749_11920 [Phycisphaerales bacterium]
MALSFDRAISMFLDVLGAPHSQGPGWMKWECRVERRPAVITLRERAGACLAAFDKPWPDTGPLANIGFIELPGERAAVWLLRHLVETNTCAGRTNSRWPREAGPTPLAS